MQAQQREASSAEAAEAGADLPGWHAIAWQYIRLGFLHIVPRGSDHILFVLGLFLSCRALRPLLVQVTSFTVAHSLTLALAALGLVRLQAGVVEPLIALSIAWVGIENLVLRGRPITPWRPLIVFMFGLLHGLGFAGVLLELGLPRKDFIAGLLAFNVGVELGQLSVLLVAWLGLRALFARAWYQAAIATPMSLAIAGTGLYWTLTRLIAGA